MDKYFEVKPGSRFYEEYFAHEGDKPKILSAFKEVCEKFGIEADEFYIDKDMFRIVPTASDRRKFSGMMKQSNDGEFKKNSEVSKMWMRLVRDIEHFEKPHLLFHFNLLGCRWKERVFHMEDQLYCSIESDGEISVPDFVTEMKASDFYQIFEEYRTGMEQRKSAQMPM